MNITQLQRRYDNGKAAIKAFEEAMPNVNECTKHIYLERDGDKVKNNFGHEIILASVKVELENLLRVYDLDKYLPYIVISDIESKYNISSRHINVPVEAIKPLIKVLEDLIKV